MMSQNFIGKKPITSNNIYSYSNDRGTNIVAWQFISLIATDLHLAVLRVKIPSREKPITSNNIYSYSNDRGTNIVAWQFISLIAELDQFVEHVSVPCYSSQHVHDKKYTLYNEQKQPASLFVSLREG